MKAAYWIILLSPWFVGSTCAPIPITRTAIDMQGLQVQNLEINIGPLKLPFEARVHTSLYPGNSGSNSLVIRLKNRTSQAVDWKKSGLLLSSHYGFDFDSLNKVLANNVKYGSFSGDDISGSGYFNKLSKDMVRKLKKDTVFLHMHLETVTGDVSDTTIKFLYFKQGGG
jgi:hypothetical protein